MQYDATISIAKTYFSEAFSNGTYSEQGNQPSEVVQWDMRATEEAFGFKFKYFENMVVDVVSQYLSLLAEGSTAN